MKPCLGDRGPDDLAELQDDGLLALLHGVKGAGQGQEDQESEDTDGDRKRPLHGLVPPGACLKPDSRESQGIRAFWSASTMYRDLAAGRIVVSASR